MIKCLVGDMSKIRLIKFCEFNYWLQFILLFFCLSICDSTYAQNTEGVKYTLNNVSIQTLTYNGQSFLERAVGTADLNITSAVFEEPNKNLKSYGWGNNSLDNGAFIIRGAIRSNPTPNSIQHIFRQGLSDSLTARYDYSTPNSNTLKVDVSITNNDSINTLKRINLGYLYLLQTPGPINSYPVHTSLYAGQYGAFISLFFKGTWGSVAYYLGDYNSSTAISTHYGSTTQQNFPLGLSNSSTNQIGGLYEDPIPPLATKKYTVYLKFGSNTETESSLAADAYASYRNSFPYLVSWQDRRPIARLFIAEGTKGSATNPRGYLWDDTLNAFNQTTFNQRVLAWADNAVSVMSNLNPKPQGMMLWDLEGQEFYHYFTYVGYPNKLPEISPEMDAVADQFFKKFTNAGFRVGMTLRPMQFLSGTTLPATCKFNVTTTELSDVFIKTNATYPNRGFTCTAPNTWTQIAPKHPYFQTVLDEDQDIYQSMKSKIAYAKNRWGATIFYVDSTVYSRGAAVNFNIFRQLQKDFPDVLLFPENENTFYWSSSAPYNQANMGVFETPQYVKNLYPQAFSMIQPFDGPNFQDATIRNRFINAIKGGDILYYNGWFADTANKNIENLYKDAGYLSGETPSVPSGVTAQATSATEIKLTWNPSTATNLLVTGYKVFRNGIAIGTVANPTFTDTGLDSNTTYNYTVSAINAAMNSSAQSSTASTKTLFDSATPQAPGMLRVVP
jgi:hypothetical protein